MANFCFFTDHTLINVQSDKAFGPTNSNPDTAYRIQNLHTGTAPLPAFAITQGQILVQEVAGQPTLVNLVLKPGIQPDFDFPKIEYIIYKGVLKNSLINGAEVAAESTNDLTESIWQAQTKRNEKVEEATGVNPGETPNSACLGINYTSSAATPYTATDNAPLDLAFFNTEGDFQLPTVQKGWEIGQFDMTNFGVLIAFERIANPHKFGLARELDSIISVTALGGAPTQAETFEHNHDKERVLSYFDDAAFFGAFYLDNLDVKIAGEFEETSGDDIYDLLVSKYINKNAVYIDIRNEFDTSFDYYLNYGRNIKASFADGGATTSLDFYRDNWPILKLDLTDFPAGNSTEKNFINLSIPQGANYKGLVYLAKAFKKKTKFRKLRYAKKFEELDFSSGFSDDITLITPNKEGGVTTPISGYYQLVYVKRQLSANLPGDFSPEHLHYLDFIFPVFPNPIPFQGTSGVIKYKTYDGISYVDTMALNGTVYMSSPCYSQDDYNVTLIASPRCYLHGSNTRISPTTSLVGEEVNNDGHFLDHLSDKLKKTAFITVDVTIDGVPDKLVLQKEKLGEFSDSIFNKNDPEFLSVIIEKSAYFNLLTQINASSIVSKYGVWIYVENILHSIDSLGRPITEIDLGLSGLEHLGNSVSRKNLTTTIKSYADEHI